MILPESLTLSERIPSSLSMVFVPGLLCDAAIWNAVAQTFSCRHATSIADLTQDDSITAMAERLLKDAPPSFILIGLSMGGYVAQEILAIAPERVAAVILLDTSASPDDPARVQERSIALQSLDIGQFRGVTSTMMPRLIDRRHLHGPISKAVQDMALRVGSETFLRQQKAIMARRDFRPVLSTITQPALVAVGDCDTLTPPEKAIEIFRLLQKPSFYLFHQCGHLPPIEQPSRTARVIQTWLNSVTVDG